MKLNRMLMLAGLAGILAIGVNTASAQGQGGGRPPFDPAQMRQRMMDNYRQQFDVKDDAEWKVLETQIGKVMDARMDVGFGGGMRGMRPPRNNANGAAPADPQARQRRNPFGAPSAAAEALQKALDAKAPAAEIQTKLAAYRADVKAKEAKLDQAQEDLKKILTPQQEAAAVLGGLLK